MATWQEPEPFSVQSVADLNTVGASMEPQFFTQMDGSAALTCLVWGNDAPKRVVWKNEDGEEVEHKEGMVRNVSTAQLHVSIFLSSLTI